MLEKNNQFDINKSCCFTGHRIIKNDLNEKNLYCLIEKLTEKYQIFYVGMALGFDTLCCEILVNLKQKKDIKIIACIPCELQDKYFNNKQKKQYKNLLTKVDKKIYLSREYTPYCMMKRNMFMVDNSSLVVCYLNQETGGTKNTVNYALKQGKRVLNTKGL